jgi:hypothetical protein
VAKREAKKVVQEARFNAYDELYEMLGMKDGQKNIYKLDETREKQDIYIVSIALKMNIKEY